MMTHVATILNDDGSEGRQVEVIRGEIHDYSGGTLYAGTADQCAQEQKTWRIPTRLVPTECRDMDGEPEPNEVLHWSYATAESVKAST